MHIFVSKHFPLEHFDPGPLPPVSHSIWPVCSSIDFPVNALLKVPDLVSTQGAEMRASVSVYFLKKITLRLTAQFVSVLYFEGKCTSWTICGRSFQWLDPEFYFKKKKTLRRGHTLKHDDRVEAVVYACLVHPPSPTTQVHCHSRYPPPPPTLILPPQCFKKKRC